MSIYDSVRFSVSRFSFYSVFLLRVLICFLIQISLSQSKMSSDGACRQCFFFFLTNASCLIFITSYLNQGSCHSWLSGSIKVSQRLWIIMIHVYWFGQIITLSYLARICKKRNIITNKNLGGSKVDSYQLPV